MAAKLLCGEALSRAGGIPERDSRGCGVCEAGTDGDRAGLRIGEDSDTEGIWDAAMDGGHSARSIYGAGPGAAGTGAEAITAGAECSRDEEAPSEIEEGIAAGAARIGAAVGGLMGGGDAR